MKKCIIILLLLLIPSLSFSETYTVERVVDGDTIKLSNGERVRLIGIDTPESKPNDKAKRDSKRTGQDVETITKMGQEATEFLKTACVMLEGKKVRLEFDVEKRDKYGRLLAYVYFDYPPGVELEQVPDCYYGYNGDVTYVFINASIMMAGYATPMTIPPNVKYADLFKKLYQEAGRNLRGLWKIEGDPSQISTKTFPLNSDSSVTTFIDKVTESGISWGDE